jgi:uncharacterized protein (DUF2267 family)
MEMEKMLREIRDRAHLKTTGEAAKAVHAVLEMLTCVLPRDEADDLASELPAEFKEIVLNHLGEAGTARDMSWGGLTRRVKKDLTVGRTDAEQITRIVFAVIKEAVSAGEVEDVITELPRELQDELSAV